MRSLIASLLLALPVSLTAQHCPWDCTGMLMLKTDATAAEIKKLQPALVDENKNTVIDTLYGTGSDQTFDTCYFLLYNDFVKYRAGRIQLHHWYAFDTLFHFAEGNYVVHYNYCKYGKEGKLFIRYNDSSGTSGYRYKEVTAMNRIHLHDYNREIREHQTDQLRKTLSPFVIDFNRKDLQ